MNKWTLVTKEDNFYNEQYGKEVNSEVYGRFVWITKDDDEWLVETSNSITKNSENSVLKTFSSLGGAKRWVKEYIEGR